MLRNLLRKLVGPDPRVRSLEAIVAIQEETVSNLEGELAGLRAKLAGPNPRVEELEVLLDEMAEEADEAEGAVAEMSAQVHTHETLICALLLKYGETEFTGHMLGAAEGCAFVAAPSADQSSMTLSLRTAS